MNLLVALKAETSEPQVRQPCLEQQGTGALCTDILRAWADQAHNQRGRQWHCKATDLRYCGWCLQPVREVSEPAHYHL